MTRGQQQGGEVSTKGGEHPRRHYGLGCEIFVKGGGGRGGVDGVVYVRGNGMEAAGKQQAGVLTVEGADERGRVE
jgi:hypothetical protein